MTRGQGGVSLEAGNDTRAAGAVWGALRVLEQHGLIWDRGEHLVPPPHDMQHESEITDYGDYLIDRLAEHEGDPGAGQCVLTSAASQPIRSHGRHGGNVH